MPFLPTFHPFRFGCISLRTFSRTSRTNFNIFLARASLWNVVIISLENFLISAIFAKIYSRRKYNFHLDQKMNDKIFSRVKKSRAKDERTIPQFRRPQSEFIKKFLLPIECQSSMKIIFHFIFSFFNSNKIDFFSPSSLCALHSRRWRNAVLFIDGASENSYSYALNSQIDRRSEKHFASE
jgi:hypothetical protein